MPASLPAQDHQTLEFQVGLEYVYMLVFVLCVSSVRVFDGLADHRVLLLKPTCGNLFLCRIIIYWTEQLHCIFIDKKIIY